VEEETKAHARSENTKGNQPPIEVDDADEDEILYGIFEKQDEPQHDGNNEINASNSQTANHDSSMQDGHNLRKRDASNEKSLNDDVKSTTSKNGVKQNAPSKGPKSHTSIQEESKVEPSKSVQDGITKFLLDKFKVSSTLEGAIPPNLALTQPKPAIPYPNPRDPYRAPVSGYYDPYYGYAGYPYPAAPYGYPGMPNPGYHPAAAPYGAPPRRPEDDRKRTKSREKRESRSPRSRSGRRSRSSKSSDKKDKKKRSKKKKDRK